MPLKFTKDIASHLIKYVRRVDISYNPVDKRATSAKELLRQLSSKRFQISNPKMMVSRKLAYSAAAPKVVFKLVNDTEVAFDSEEYQCKDLLENIFYKAMEIDMNFELEGKNIDDLM